VKGDWWTRAVERASLARPWLARDDGGAGVSTGRVLTYRQAPADRAQTEMGCALRFSPVHHGLASEARSTVRLGALDRAEASRTRV
jgi:hypothetical protein